MRLSKYKIGELVSVVDERNSFGIRDFYGININKEFMPTVANTDNIDERKYKVVRKNRFVYSGMQTGRDECIRISMYSGENIIVVSPAYTTFEVSATDKIIPFYFFMLFLSKEKDRLGWFSSDSSIRSNLDWDVFCDIELSLPPLSIQQKYVDIYNAMVANQQCYERGLSDLKLVCDVYIEGLKAKYPLCRIGDYIVLSNKKNTGNKISTNKAASIEKTLVNAHADLTGVNLSNYFVVEKGMFAYNTVTTKNGDKISIAYNDGEPCLVSPIYTVFEICKNGLAPEYLMLWFKRDEFDRYARFHSWGSAREMFTFSDMCDVSIPIPDLCIQQSIANIFKVYTTRKNLNERLKAQIKEICPVLIKGSLDEANA